MELHSKVIRGPQGDWRGGEIDGGAGEVGEVLEIYANSTVKVRWLKTGTEFRHKIGMDNTFELNHAGKNPLSH